MEFFVKYFTGATAAWIEGNRRDPRPNHPRQWEGKSTLVRSDLRFEHRERAPHEDVAEPAERQSALRH